MTVLDPAAVSALMTTSQAGHPSVGRIGEAVLVPWTATTYRLLVHDRTLGFLQAVGEFWIASKGADISTAVPAGQHRSVVAAARELAA